MSSIIPTPDLFQAKRVLAIQPHYDDNDIGAGGTLSALAKSGTEIIYLTVTDDLMGVLDPSIPDAEAKVNLEKEQDEAGAIIGVSRQVRLGYPDAGNWDPFHLRADLLKFIRMIKPDFVFTPDPWLDYEAHRDHIETGLAAASAANLYALPRLPSSDPHVDETYQPHEVVGVVFYYTREPNTAVDIGSTRKQKEEAIRCYRSQFSLQDTEMVLQVLDFKEREFAEGKPYSHAESFKVMAPVQLHCGI
jgi:LmbE family N-acetylglucosaminyl deacetylase